MKTSLELMVAFTSNREPLFTYAEGETMKGSEFTLSAKQLNWLLSLIQLEMPRPAPKGFNPVHGTQREDDSYWYNLHTRKGKPLIRKTLKSAYVGLT